MHARGYGSATLPVAAGAARFSRARSIGRISILDSLRGVKLVLCDEAQRRLISFREARRLI